MPSDLQSQLRKYVDVILDVGLNLQRGQRLLIVNNLLHGVDVEMAPFVRLVVEAAYRRGSPFVDVIWEDPQIEKLRLKKAPGESLAQYPKWPSAARLEHAEAGDAYLALRNDDPDLLTGIEPARVGSYLDAIRAPTGPIREYMSRNDANWCVAGVSAPAWARKVLPDVPASTAGKRLWKLIFSVCRIDQPNPVASWRKHVSDLVGRAEYLTRKQYTSLVYTGPGTHLTLGLPPGHIWSGGRVRAENGVDFVPNLPTEEAFTLPDRSRAEGEVTSTKPFGYGGSTIDGMRLTFAGGKVVEFKARKEQALLEQLLRVDEGSSRLGEVALVPHSSPVSRLGVTFHNVLFDENAACHLAFGDAYRFSLQDAAGQSEDEFARRGGNSSKVHHDFMIGSARLNVDGLRADGVAEPILRSGEWAFKV